MPVRALNRVLGVNIEGNKESKGSFFIDIERGDRFGRKDTKCSRNREGHL